MNQPTFPTFSGPTDQRAPKNIPVRRTHFLNKV